MSTPVLDKLPHRAPFRFISEVEVVEPGVRGVGLWRVSGGEDFFRGHFPGEPIVPGVLLAEALAQLAGIVAFASGDAPARPARLAQVNVKFSAGVSPPAAIRLHAALAKEMSGLRLFDVRAEVAGSIAAAGTLVLASMSEPIGNPGDSR